MQLMPRAIQTVSQLGNRVGALFWILCMPYCTCQLSSQIGNSVTIAQGARKGFWVSSSQRRDISP